MRNKIVNRRYGKATRLEVPAAQLRLDAFGFKPVKRRNDREHGKTDEDSRTGAQDAALATFCDGEFKSRVQSILQLEDGNSSTYYISNAPVKLQWRGGSLVSPCSGQTVTLWIIGLLQRVKMAHVDGSPVSRVTVTIEPARSSDLAAAHILTRRHSHALAVHNHLDAGGDLPDLTIGAWSMADVGTGSGAKVVPFEAVYDARNVYSTNRADMPQLRGTDLKPGDVDLVEATVSQSMITGNQLGQPVTWVAVLELARVQLLKRDT
ncbi:hypothetical protein BV25DRAFT_1914946 [Artomyces pyxidatus]|uniref:Uncharacterized protein n=1 Tax=Artomyces pyxidatus TaxID=48021 RepID=A0ACB8T554_9AGAM|nr:hypothetical protein BV25DRAFT_1914946 [Artomyces pyxidatus]